MPQVLWAGELLKLLQGTGSAPGLAAWSSPEEWDGTRARPLLGLPWIWQEPDLAQAATATQLPSRVNQGPSRTKNFKLEFRHPGRVSLAGSADRVGPRLGVGESKDH